VVPLGPVPSVLKHVKDGPVGGTLGTNVTHLTGPVSWIEIDIDELWL
jgi:hypothetical protein